MRIKIILILLFATQMAVAQTDCFTYADAEQTIITGISVAGLRAVADDNALTIPSEIQTVRATAFSDIVANSLTLSTLMIEGNTNFELTNGKNALADVNGSLSLLSIEGSMSHEHLTNLLGGLNNTGALEKINIYDESFPLDATMTIGGSSSGVKIVLPAARVGTQTAGDAAIYGRFTLTGELATFCGRALFGDTDFGSQYLFYVPTEVRTIDAEKRLYIQRVRYILPNEGVLMHNTSGSSATVELPRMDEEPDDDQYNADATLFASNMLCGVTTPTTIGRTEVKGVYTYTNMVLYNGFFYPTSGGTLGANRAYLQVKQEDMVGMARMAISANNASMGIERHEVKVQLQQDAWYTLSGQRLTAKPQQKGIYIHQGKKVKL